MIIEFIKLDERSRDVGGKAKGLQFLPNHINTPESFILNGKQLWDSFSEKHEFEGIQTSPAFEINNYDYESLRAKFIQALANSDWDSTINVITNNLKYPIMIRSNMSCEDNNDFSQAGLFHSFKVENVTEFKEKSITILAHILNKEIILNFLEHNMDFKNFFPSLLIQEFIQSDFGGVYFTRAPASPWKDSSYCEFIQGGVNAITDGSDKSLSYSNDESILDQHSFIHTLFKVGKDLEALRNIPLDIEWISTNNKIIILQIRPINDQDIKLAFRLATDQVFDRSVTLERFPKKLSPLGWSALQSTFQLNLAVLKTEFGILAKKPEDISIIHDGIVYTDPNFFKFPSGVSLDLLKILNPLLRRTWLILANILIAPITIILKNASFFKVKLLSIFFGPLTESIINNWDQHVIDFHKNINDFKNGQESDGPMTPQILLKQMHQVDTLSKQFLYNDLPIYLIKETYFKAVHGFILKKGIETEDFLEVFNHVEKNVTRNMASELVEFIRLLDKDENKELFLRTFNPEVLTESKQSWFDFIKLNGHIINSWDIMTPTWEENPSQLLSFLQLEKEKTILIERPFLEKTLSELLEKNPLVKKLILDIRKLIEIDEEQHFLSGNLLGLSRNVINKVGKFLIERKILENRGQIFFLQLDEIKSALSGNNSNLSLLANSRQARWNRIQDTNPIFTLSNKTYNQSESQKLSPKKEQLSGLGVSKGNTFGTVQIIHNLKDFDSNIKNTILVLQTPNPIFTPFFSEINGIISESGSFLSHGFVSAREYLLPAISEVKDITNILKNGDQVSINGSTGEITLINQNVNI